MKIKSLLKTALKFILLIFLGLIITWAWAGSVPFDGPELGIGPEIGCGHPAGFPFAFRGSWKYLEGVLHPDCFIDVNYFAFGLDILFWTMFLYVAWRLVKKLFRKFKSPQKVQVKGHSPKK